MRKTIVLAGLSMLLCANLYAVGLSDDQSNYKMQNDVLQNKPELTATYNVRIELVDIHGNPVNGSTGLHGYWARNESTGEYFEPGGQEDADKFTDLPAGTYSFGAYEGAWDGAVSKKLNLADATVGPDGFIVVQLTYWVE